MTKPSKKNAFTTAMNRGADALLSSKDDQRNTRALRSRGPVDNDTWAPRRPIEYKSRTKKV